MSAAEALPALAAADSPAACVHCGLDVPAGRLDRGAGGPFCCGGCEVAFGLIHASGLDRYYRLPERRRFRVEPSGKRFDEFDHPSFEALYVRERADGLAETSLYLEGVHCASCVWLVERLALAVPGAAQAELNVTRSLARVAWDPAATRLSAIARFLDSLGYRPHPFRALASEALRRAEDRAMLVRIGVAGAIAGNVMMLALALYSGWFGGMEGTWERYFRWVSLILTTPAVLGPGRVFFRGALQSIRARVPHVDLPVAVALAAAFTRGAVNIVTDRGPIYFDGVATLIFLLLVGRFLQQRAQRAAAGSAELLQSFTPRAARVVPPGGGEAREIPLEALLPGMTAEVRAGETIPADGTVSSGRTTLDLSLLTGETRAVEVGVGDRVFAGTVNRRARIELAVEETGESSRLGRLMREVEAASRQRPPVVELADRLAGWFVVVVLALAVATGWIWLGRDPARALDNAIALLIVTCPCALALATPLALSVAAGRAARAGILVKGRATLELLARPGTLFLDKTGTLTEGTCALAAWDGPEWVKPLVVALERHSSHPIAAGFRSAWAASPVAEAEEVSETAGGGIQGRVHGRHVIVGSPAFVAATLEPGGAARAATPRIAPDSDAALSPVAIAVDGAIVARAGFGDRVRPEAAEAVARLRARGWRLRLLSGDDPAVVARVGAELGFEPAECRGGASPEDKRAVVEEASRRGTAVMVGDGVNDAAAIARASVGIGVRGGAEACLEAADVFLARPGVGSLVPLMDGAARAFGLIRLNVALSLIYNLAGVVLAVTGVINPLIAAILMPLSSLTVVLVSWRGRTFRAEAA